MEMPTFTFFLGQTADRALVEVGSSVVMFAFWMKASLIMFTVVSWK